MCAFGIVLKINWLDYRLGDYINVSDFHLVLLLLLGQLLSLLLLLLFQYLRHNSICRCPWRKNLR